MESEKNQINLDTIFKAIRVENIPTFTLYLKEIWMDLAQRTDQKFKGITKLVFTSYYNLPGILSERLFAVFDSNRNGFLDLTEFVNGMKTLFCGEFDQNSKFIFKFYDFDKDGQITSEDIRTVLSYINLNNENNQLEGYKQRVHSQDELFKILEKCYEKIEGEYMTYEMFRHIVQNINSDIYLIILLFLFEKKPFTKVGLQNYEKQQDIYMNISPHIDSIMEGIKSKSPTQLIAPSKSTTFSPYALFIRPSKKRKTTITENKILLKEKLMQGTFIRTNKKRMTLQQINLEKRFQLIPVEEIISTERQVPPPTNYPKITNKINTHFDKDSISTNKDRPIYGDINLMPAFKQTNFGKTMRKKENSETSSINSKIIIEQDEEEQQQHQLTFDSNDEGNDEDDEEDLTEDKEEVVQHEGFLFKHVNGKMKHLWFKLFHKDLYYFSNHKEKNHKGMHNLSGLFLQEEPMFTHDNINYFCFSVVYPNKTRYYFVDNQESFTIWIDKLKIATGYTELSELYEINEKVGNGKFGLVKLGIHKKTGAPVAIKIMSKTEMNTQDLELVRTEIEILRICQHPNIIKLLEVFENVRFFYIIMEYCSGGDLFSYLMERGYKLEEHKACELIHKMCAAVFYIHSYGITHRDLKPENILMTSTEDDADIRILDFGLSKIIGPEERCTEPYGTLSYVAPEVLQEKPYTKAVDLWSIGVITYFCLSGRLPFDSQVNDQEIARKIIYEPPPYKGQIWEKISPEAKRFIDALLEKNSAIRMNIKECLEHEWIRKYGGKSSLTEVRRKSKDLKQSTFEMYSSVSNI